MNALDRKGDEVTTVKVPKKRRRHTRNVLPCSTVLSDCVKYTCVGVTEIEAAAAATTATASDVA